MKKLLSLALALALCLSLTVPAYAAAGDFTIEDGVLTSYNGSARSVVIPSNVSTIGSWAFAGCEGMTSVTIPSNVTVIEEGAFATTRELTSISVDPQNTHFVSVDGVLFVKGKTILLKYPNAKTGSSYTVPDGVNRIGADAFSWMENSPLSTVVIPSSVTSIGDGAFFPVL